MHDIIIIGAGTAGLSAAIYAVREGKSVLVLEKSYYGGQIVNSPNVANYPGIANVSGFDFVTGLFKQAKGLGMEYKTEEVKEVTQTESGDLIVKTASNEYRCRALIVACGVVNRKLEIPGEKEFTGRGVSYCATCDGAFYKGKKTAVIGGGNTALDDAAVLSGYCSEVFLIHRRDQFRASANEVDRVEAIDNITIMTGYKPVRIEDLAASASDGDAGDEDAKKDTVKAAAVAMPWAQTSSQNKKKLVLSDVNSGEERSVEVDGIFVAVGQIPSNYIFKDLVEIDDHGYIVAGEDCRTSNDRIFAAGDCRTKEVRQLVTAASDGAVAALAACRSI